MTSFGKTSSKRIQTCNDELQRLFLLVVRTYDCSILCGTRGKEAQTKAYESGNSSVQYPDSRHNKFPSDAVDIAPYPIDWGEEGSAEQRKKAIARFYHFAGYVKAKAEVLGIDIRWGGDWDGDNDFSDQSFDDLVHWETK